MSAFLILRAVFFALFVLIHGVVCTTAAINVSSSPESSIRSVDIYLIFYSSASILFMLPLVLVDVLRRGAILSTVRFECLWLLFSWVLNLCGSSAVTALVPTPYCKQNGSVADSCTSAQALVPVTWTATALVTSYLCLLVVMSAVYSVRHPAVWTTSVRDFEWFNGGGTSKTAELPSNPPSPTFAPRRLTLNANPTVTHLERMAEGWQATSAPMTQVRVQAMSTLPLGKPARGPTSSEPQPLTFDVAPSVPTAKPAVHYTASAIVAVGVLPSRKLSVKRKIPAPAPPTLYPSYVQTVASPTRMSTAPETITYQASRTHASSQPTSDEPLPIRNWPRVNPQQPLRKQRTSDTPVVSSMQTPVIPLGTPGPVPASSAPAPPTRRNSRPRNRPPPLDLSAASPARIR